MFWRASLKRSLISISSSRKANYNALSSAFLSDSKSIRINPFVSFNRSRFAADIFKAIDGKRSSREIIDFVFNYQHSVVR